MDVEEYGSGHSALPEPLSQAGSLFLSHADNCVYVGPIRNVAKATLAQHMIDPQYFDCINNTRFQLDIPDVQVTDTSGASITTKTTTNQRTLVVVVTTMGALLVSVLWAM